MTGHETHDHDHDHEHDQHGHGGHHHEHPAGIVGFFYGLFVPHTHDAAESIDNAMESSARGIRAVKVSLVGLGVTAIFQMAVFLVSGSVALLADTIHNFSDAFTAVPLWIAFIVGRRRPSRRYTFGLGRAEDLAGLFIVAMIALSAILAGWESILRLAHPRPLDNLGWVFAAGLIGFAGNELVAIYRIRVGKTIGSAALVADGVHARTDGFTSLAVVLGVIGVWAGFPLADPIIGLLITIAIAMLLWGTTREIGRRLLDGVDPALVYRAETALTSVEGIDEIETIQLRWSGHRLYVAIAATAPGAMSISDFQILQREARHACQHALPSVGVVTLTPTAGSTTRE